MKRLILVLALPALLVVGCGGGDSENETTNAGGSGSTAAAIQLFNDNGCAGCHTLSEADAKGPLGPNLDDAGLSVDRVRDQIENGGGSMPSFKGSLTPDEIDQLAQFVSEASQS